ncbi:MAG: branched-chain amino acid transporter permease [Clostridiales bacterium]|nr:branched-chain amino acid transporter permease [Clostridiales bacterium]
MNESYVLAGVAVCAAVTMLIRALPFLVFKSESSTPAWVSYLGSVLPYAIMSMLVVYCLRDVRFSSPSYGLPELIGCAVVAVLHVWKSNTLLSIVCGTVTYMLLVQLIFV